MAEARGRIGAEVRRHISAALGTGAWPEVKARFETVFCGAFLQVGTNDLSYRGMANRLYTMLALILPEDDH